MNNCAFIRAMLYRSRLSRCERRVINNLAQGLCIRMHIPAHDHQVVALLGLGSETNNREAVETWILAELGPQGLALDAEAFDILADRLECQAVLFAAGWV